MDFPLLRQEKGAPLTHQEMDVNWLRSAVSLGTWRSDFYYTVNEMVNLNGVIYKSLSGNLGKSPATYPADWVVWFAPHSHGFADIIGATSDDETLALNSAVLVPTQRAVKQFVLSQISSVSYTDEEALDAVGSALVSTNSINFTYNGGPRTINADVRLNGGSLTISVDGLAVATGGIASGMLADGAVVNAKIADGTIAEVKLDIQNSPTNGYVLMWSDAFAKMAWTDLTPLLYTDEQAIDAIAGVLIAGAGISIDLSDPHSGITISLGATTAPANYTLKLSDDTTPLEVSATPIDTFYVPFDLQVSALSASLTTASTTGDVELTLYRNGVEMLTSRITIEESEGTSLTAATQPEAIAGQLDWLAGDKIEIYLTAAGVAATGLKLSIGYASTVVIDGTPTGQTAIQFKDEGTNLGAAGNVATLDFTGPGVEVTRVGSTVTVNIPASTGGLSWSTITAADVSPALTQTGYVMLTGGTLRELELPANVPPGFIVRVVSVGAQVRVLSNGNVIANVGAGNDLLLAASRMVELVGTSTGNLQITDYSVLP